MNKEYTITSHMMRVLVNAAMKHLNKIPDRTKEEDSVYTICKHIEENTYNLCEVKGVAIITITDIEK